MNQHLLLLLIVLTILFHGTTSIPMIWRTQSLQTNGIVRWTVHDNTVEVDPASSAIIVVDMWDKHWCPSATDKVQMLSPFVNRTINKARRQGFLIIHAPSEVSEYYVDHPARKWVLALPDNQTATRLKYDPNEPIPPISFEYGCDTSRESPRKVWNSQNNLITIHDEDAIIDNELQIFFNVLQSRKIVNIFYMGVHENKCIMDRRFSLKQTLDWGYQPVLVRDAVDALYSPDEAPYVSHEEGTRLMTEYIEKFWAPSVSAYDFILYKK